jgi:hypothetical protein
LNGEEARQGLPTHTGSSLASHDSALLGANTLSRVVRAGEALEDGDVVLAYVLADLELSRALALTGPDRSERLTEARRRDG